MSYQTLNMQLMIIEKVHLTKQKTQVCDYYCIFIFRFIKDYFATIISTKQKKPLFERHLFRFTNVCKADLFSLRSLPSKPTLLSFNLLQTYAFR